jgi:GNAT superfamily N-acetyltransferase
MIVVRQAEARDADRIHELIVALAIYEKEPDAVVCTADDLRAQLAADRPPFECLLAEEEGVAHGFALFFHNYSTWRGRPGLYLEDLFVDPAERGKGIGKRLLSELASIAVSRGCARMEWSVLDWNDLAITFYEALGANSRSEWTTYRLTGEPLERLAAGAGAGD